MRDRPDGAEFGPATQFIENYEYYEAIGASLRLEMGEDEPDRKLIPGYTITPENIEATGTGYRVVVREDEGMTVEKVKRHWEPDSEVVTWSEGGFTILEQHRNGGENKYVKEVEIVD